MVLREIDTNVTALEWTGGNQGNVRSYSVAYLDTELSVVRRLDGQSMEQNLSLISLTGGRMETGR